MNFTIFNKESPRVLTVGVCQSFEVDAIEEGIYIETFTRTKPGWDDDFRYLWIGFEELEMSFDDWVKDEVGESTLVDSLSTIEKEWDTAREFPGIKFRNNHNAVEDVFSAPTQSLIKK